MEETIMQEAYGVAAFRSRQQVLWFEQALRARGVPVSVITTPRDISMGCGLSVRFPLSRAGDVRQAARMANSSNLIGLYRADRDGPRLRVTPLRHTSL